MCALTLLDAFCSQSNFPFHTAPVFVLDTPSVEYFVENRTLTIHGSGFQPDFLSRHAIVLSQEESDFSVAYCNPVAVTSSELSCQLAIGEDSRLSGGAIFASVSLFDGEPSPQRLIGYYQSYSIFSLYEAPLTVNLQTSSRLQFTLSSVGWNDPPNWSTLIEVESIVSSALDIMPSLNLYSRLVYQDTGLVNLTYNLEVYFTSANSISKFNSGSLPSNLSLITQLEESISTSTNGVYTAQLTFSSPTIDSSWPYLVYLISPTQSSESSAPSNQEISIVRSFAATLWDVAPAALLPALRPATAGSGYEITLYFKTPSSAAIFNTYELPLNDSATGDELNSIVLAASSGAFSCVYVRSSPFTRKNQVIDVSWQLIKFLLQPLSSNSSSLSAAGRDAIAQNLYTLFNISSVDLVTQFSEAGTSRKRLASSLEATFFFATATASSSFFSLGMPFNDTAIQFINSNIVSASNGTYNSTYIGSNILAPRSDGAVSTGTSVPWVAIFVPIGAVLLVIVIIAIVFFRRRTLQMRRLEAQVDKLPDDLRSVLSIKSNDLVMGKKLGEGSFGAVYLGEYKGRKVAIKRLANNMISSHVADFFREASVMLSIPKNTFIVEMIGMCQELSNFRSASPLPGK
jgi:hypothetical protein